MQFGRRNLAEQLIRWRWPAIVVHMHVERAMRWWRWFQPPDRTRAPMRFRALGLLSALLGCAGDPKTPRLIADETNGPLANVILLPLTIRSTDELLGHAWSLETDLADPLRAVLSGSVVVTSTDQHITFFREAMVRGEVAAQLGIADANGSLSRVTHLLYDVRITSIAAFASGSLRYNPESACCLQGNPTDDCLAGYVHRLLRGSGSIKMLHRISGTASAGVQDVLVARGGAQYRVLDDSSFNDAYFGLELSPLESVCRTLTPDQEMAPLQLKAAPNCVVQRYSALGERETLPRQLPNEQLCRAVAEHYCSELPTLLSCRVRFGDAEEMDVSIKSEPARPEPVELHAPVSTERPSKKRP